MTITIAGSEERDTQRPLRKGTAAGRQRLGQNFFLARGRPYFDPMILFDLADARRNLRSPVKRGDQVIPARGNIVQAPNDFLVDTVDFGSKTGQGRRTLALGGTAAGWSGSRTRAGVARRLAAHR